jgi:hypothetical protein
MVIKVQGGMKIFTQELTWVLCKIHLAIDIDITIKGTSIVILLILKIVGRWVCQWGEAWWSKLTIEHTIRFKVDLCSG